MVLPIAFGAAVAASAAVLKAKCTLVAAGEGCGNQRNKAPGPRASQVNDFSSPALPCPRAVVIPFSSSG
jgi:hypothetical protein